MDTLCSVNPKDGFMFVRGFFSCFLNFFKIILGFVAYNLKHLEMTVVMKELYKQN